MLYVLAGSDEVKIRDKMREIVSSLRKKQPDAEVIWLSDHSERNFDSVVTSQGIFFSKHIVIVEIEPDKNQVKQMAKSPHIFVLLEGKLDAKKTKLYKESAKKVDVYDVKKDDVNVFSIANYFVDRKKEMLWREVQKLREKNISFEEMHGILLWQINAIRRAVNSKSAKEAGLKPFVYTKAKNAEKKYTKKEIEKIASDLVDCLLLSRSGILNFEERFEEIITAI